MFNIKMNDIKKDNNRYLWLTIRNKARNYWVDNNYRR